MVKRVREDESYISHDSTLESSICLPVNKKLKPKFDFYQLIIYDDSVLFFITECLTLKEISACILTCKRWNATMKNYLPLFFHISRHKNINENLFDFCSKGNEKMVKYLLFHGANVNYYGRKGKTNSPIVLASENGHLELVKYLVSKGATIHALGNFCFVKACQNGHLYILEYLMEKQVNFNIAVDIQSTMKNAVKHGFVKVVKHLKPYWYYALYNYLNDFVKLACENGKLEMVKFLLLLKTNLFQIDYTSSFLICCEKGHVDIIDYLFHFRPLDTFPLKNGIEMASYHGQLEVIKKIMTVSENTSSFLN